MTTFVDDARAKLVVSRVQEAFRSRTGILSETDDLVENQIPFGVISLSREHALFLFYTVANDHGMKSSRLYSEAKRLFVEDGDLFVPLKILSDYMGPEDERLITATGKRLGTRYPKETAKSWYLNSKRLVDKYDGDPRNMLWSTSDARALMKEIMGFRGYGPKIGGMFLRAAVGLGFARVSGLEQVLVPVDIHDSRISFMTEILKPSNKGSLQDINYYDYVTQVQRVLLQTCNSLGLEWLDTDRALWLIGSRGCVNGRCGLCPLSEICTVGNAVLSSGLPQHWSSRTKRNKPPRRRQRISALERKTETAKQMQIGKCEAPIG